MWAMRDSRVVRQAEVEAKGTTFREITLADLRHICIPLPRVAEQRAIAAALTDADALLAGLDRLIAKKRDLKQAAMQQLLTGQTRLPGFLGNWTDVQLSCIADVLKGNALSKSMRSASGIRPCILYGELFTTYGRVITSVVGRTNSSEGCASVAGDVLMPGSTTTTGADLATAAALLIDGVALGGDILIVRQKGSSYDPIFLANLLTYAKRQEVAELTQGITIHHLYGRDLKTLAIKLPPLAEQSAIASVVTDIDAELTALEARRDKTRALKQGMMQELLTGRIRLV
jgi:type I restriction enzyme, S subunit